MRNAENLKLRCGGRFGDILKSLVPELSEIIDKGARGSPCPVCGTGTDRASPFIDFETTGGIACRQCPGGKIGADIFEVLQMVVPCSFNDAYLMIEEMVGNDISKNNLSFPVKKTTPKTYSKEKAEFTKIWEEAIPNHERLLSYSKFRGIKEAPPSSIRFHPSLKYFQDGKHAGTFPAAIFRHTFKGKGVGLHFIYLSDDDDGKAPVDVQKKSKKCVDNLAGSVMELFPLNFSKPLFLCEGVETALAIHQKYGSPVWATGWANLLKAVVLPIEVNEVVIAVDKDRSGAGEMASQILSDRLVESGIKVSLLKIYMEIPAGKKSIDYLDVLNQEEEKIIVTLQK